jgi:hypothetical protein
MPWEEGRMDIQAAQARDFKDGPRQDLPVRDDHEHVRVQRLEFFHLIPDALRLQHGYACSEGAHLHPGRGQNLLPAHWLVRLGDDGHHFMRVTLLGKQRLQRGQANVTRAEVSDAHAVCCRGKREGGG